MARLDPSRSAVEVDELELTVANLLLTSPDDELLTTENGLHGLAALEEAGIAAGRVIDGYPAILLRAFLYPELQIVVERFYSDAPLCSFAAVAGEVGVWGEPAPGGANEYTPIEPTLIPWQIARSVGLGPRPRSRRDEPLEFRAATLDVALASGDLEAAAVELETDPGLDAAARDVLMELLPRRRTSWRVVSLWTNENGEKQAAGVSAIDGGDAGLWLTTYTEEAVITLTPTESGVVWDRIVDLVPYSVGSNAEPVA